MDIDLVLQRRLYFYPKTAYINAVSVLEDIVIVQINNKDSKKRTNKLFVKKYP